MRTVSAGTRYDDELSFPALVCCNAYAHVANATAVGNSPR
jgi:hypothetical protein